MLLNTPFGDLVVIMRFFFLDCYKPALKVVGSFLKAKSELAVQLTARYNQNWIVIFLLGFCQNWLCQGIYGFMLVHFGFSYVVV